MLIFDTLLTPLQIIIFHEKKTNGCFSLATVSKPFYYFYSFISKLTKSLIPFCSNNHFSMKKDKWLFFPRNGFKTVLLFLLIYIKIN